MTNQNGVPDDEGLRLPTPGEAAAALPGLARIAAATWLNAAQWGLLTSARTGRRLLAATRDPAVAAELAHELGVTVGAVGDLARAVASGVPLPEAVAAAVAAESGNGVERPPADDPSASLRDAGRRPAGALAGRLARGGRAPGVRPDPR